MGCHWREVSDGGFSLRADSDAAAPGGGNAIAASGSIRWRSEGASSRLAAIGVDEAVDGGG